MNTWDIFLQKYNEATEETRLLLNSEKISQLADEIISRQNTQKKKVSDYVIGISNYILGVINKERFQAELELTEDDLHYIVQKIDSLQNNIPIQPTIPEASKELEEQLVLRPKPPVSQIETSTTGEARPLTREDVLNALAPKMTQHPTASATDPDAEAPSVVHGYEAYQKSKESGQEKSE